MATFDLTATVQAIETYAEDVRVRLEGLINAKCFRGLTDAQQGELDTAITAYQQCTMAAVTVLSALDALQASDFPTLPTFEVPAEMVATLQEEAQEAVVAVSLFMARPVAASAHISFTEPQPKS